MTLHTNIKLVDAHHHFWNLDENVYPWLQNHPEPHFFLGSYDALKKITCLLITARTARITKYWRPSIAKPNGTETIRWVKHVG